MDTGRTVIYIDAAGVTHEALVFGQNPLNPKLLDLVYVDAAAPAADNIRKVFAIEHHEAKKETNPDLPSYALNAWKEYYEEHGIIPPDHPNFDHPFKQPDLGLNGQPIPVVRPITAAFEKAHQEFLSKEDSDELKALSGSGGMAAGVPFGEGPRGLQTIASVDIDKHEVTLDAVTSTEGLQQVIKDIAGASSEQSAVSDSSTTDAAAPTSEQDQTTGE